MPFLPQPLMLVLSVLVSAFFCRALISVGGVKDDIPNGRSSHVRPTPRGGGVAFAGAFGLFFCFLPDESHSASLLAFTAICCAWLGSVEDMKSLPSTWRLAIEGALAVAVSLHGTRLLSFDVLGQSLHVPVLVSVLLSVLWLVWMTNLYNFMDGVNGIASLQGISNSLFLGIYARSVGNHSVEFIAFSLAGTLVGFLPFNFPRAKIFMGDAGSLFIGFLLSALALDLHRSDRFTEWQAAVLFAPFLADSTITLLWRLARRERLSSAHRRHMYQRLCDLTKSHTVPTIAYTVASIICGLVVVMWPKHCIYFVLPIWSLFLFAYVVVQKRHAALIGFNVDRNFEQPLERPASW